MPTASWLTAFKKANVKPVVLMQIEDAAASEELYTTKSQWAGSTTLTNIDTDINPGDAVAQRTDSPIDDTGVSGTNSVKWRWTYTAPYDGFDALNFINSLQWTLDLTASPDPTPQSNTQNRTVTLTIRDTSHAGTVLATVTDSAYFSYGGSTFSTVKATTSTNMEFGPTLAMQSGVTYYIEASISGLLTILFDGGGTGTYVPTIQSQTLRYVAESSSNCGLTTSTIDMGAVPSSPVELSIDDTKESGASIVYTAEGNTVDSWPGTSLGTVADGDSLTAYEFYRITAAIASTSGGRGIIHQFALREGLYKWYGTHKDIPFTGVKPYLRNAQSVSNKIDLEKGLSTTGEFTADLFFLDDTSDFLASRFLLGKDVQVLLGTPELSLADYEPLITGTWRDYSFNGRDKRMKVKIQDPLKQFEKVKVPVISFNATTGANEGTTYDYLKTNGVGVITDLFDKVGLRDRYIPSDYDTLEAGALSSTDYNVTRRMYNSKPIEARKLLDRLAQALGLFLVPLGDGSIKPKLYDATEAAAYTIDATKFSPSDIEGNYKDISVMQYAWYNPVDRSNPSNDSSDLFSNGYSRLDAGRAAQLVNEQPIKTYLDAWAVGNNQAGTTPENIGDLTAPPQALIDLTSRWQSWFADPKFTVNLTGMPLWYWQIEPSDIVEINNLLVPVSMTAWLNSVDYISGDVIVNDGRQYECTVANGVSSTIYEPGTTVGWESYWEDMNTLDTGFTDGMKFITMKRSIDLKKGSVSFLFRQI